MSKTLYELWASLSIITRYLESFEILNYPLLSDVFKDDNSFYSSIDIILRSHFQVKTTSAIPSFVISMEFISESNRYF